MKSAALWIWVFQFLLWGACELIDSKVENLPAENQILVQAEAANNPFEAADNNQYYNGPQHGISLPGTVHSIYDGDTMTLLCTIRVRVRLIDCWAPELEDPGGQESREHLVELAPLGSQATLFVPFGDRPGDSVSFSRALGKVWVKNKCLNAEQVKAGFADATDD